MLTKEKVIPSELLHNAANHISKGRTVQINFFNEHSIQRHLEALRSICGCNLIHAKLYFKSFRIDHQTGEISDFNKFYGINIQKMKG